MLRQAVVPRLWVQVSLQTYWIRQKVIRSVNQFCRKDRMSFVQMIKFRRSQVIADFLSTIAGNLYLQQVAENFANNPE